MKKIIKILVSAIYLGISIWLFRNFDKDSHSASDTLINFVPAWAVLTLVYAIVVRFLLKSKKQ